jgi:lactoylglutathione lyase
MASIVDLRNVLITADDVDALIADFAMFGIGVKFRDGDRYAVLDAGAGGIGIAVAAPEDHPAPGSLVLTAKTERVGEAAEALQADGASIVRPVYRGGHEVRALVRTRGGVNVLLYGAEE